jgi:uncharacterized damage-inducible protein DinB
MSVSLIEFWEYYNEKTKGLLNLLTHDHLSFRLFESSRTLGEEIRHLLDSREIYLRALASGIGPSWKEKRMDPETAVSVDKMRSEFNRLEDQFLNFLKSDIFWDHVILWECMGNPDKETALNWYIHFECTRQGVISTYLTALNINYDITA